MNTIQKKAFKDRVERLKSDNLKLTERLAALKKEKQAVQKELTETQKLLNAIPCAVALVQDRRIVFANELIWKNPGYTKEEYLQSNLIDLIHSISSDFALRLLDDLASGRSLPERFEVYLLQKDGKPLLSEIHLKKIRFRGRSAVLLNVVGLDQRRSKEKELLQTQEMTAIGRMASELQNVLGAAGKNVSGFGNIERFFNQLQCLMKTNNDPSEVVLFDPIEAVLKAVETASIKWRRNHDSPFEIKTYLRTFRPVKGNPEEISEAFSNLILNSLEAIPDGGEVYLTTEEHSGYVWIYVQDSGIGISGNIKDSIFDPFFTTKGNNHSGLGLSLAQAIVIRNGGEIEVISEKGQGAALVVRLPLSQEIPCVSDAKRAKNRIKDSHILLVSRGNIVSDLLVQEFVSRGGKVTEAYACEEALKLLQKKNFDLVIGDTDMPDFYATGFMAILKQTKNALPVVLLVSEKNQADACSLQDLGADLLLERPLEMDRVSMRISRMMEERAMSGA